MLMSSNSIGIVLAGKYCIVKQMKSRDEYHARKNDVTDLYSTMSAVHSMLKVLHYTVL